MQDSTHQGPPTIMLVDDDKLVLNMARRSLEGQFGRVIAHTDPIAALEQLKSDGDDIDILLTDISMPGLTGPQLAQQARRMFPKLTLLFISGFVNDQQQQAMPGNSRLLCKPFTPAELVAFVAGEDRERTG